MVLVIKNPPVNAGEVRDTGLIPRSRRYPGVGDGNLLQYSCLENPMDRGNWQATVHRVIKSWTGQHTRMYTGKKGMNWSQCHTGICRACSPPTSGLWTKFIIYMSLLLPPYLKLQSPLHPHIL